MSSKKIGDVVNIRRGSSPRPIQEFLAPKGLPWVKIADATGIQSRYIYKTKEFIKPEGKKNTVEVRPGTLILSNSATPGLPKIMGITAYVHDGWLVFDNYNGILKEYLYYFFLNKRRELTIQANGSVFKNLKTEIVKNFEIELPSIEKQEKVSILLGSLDSAIELNNRINDYLVQLLESLFKATLTNEAHEWKVASLLDVANYKNGLAMQRFRPTGSDKGLPVLKIRELGQGYCGSDAERCRSDIDEAVKICDGDLVFSWSGTLLLDFWTGGVAGLNQHLFKVTSDSYPNWFYYLWTKQHMQRFISLAKDRATTMGHIKRSALQESEVLIPSEDRMRALTRQMQPLVDSMVALKVQSRKLGELRDALLPQLMSGKIDVSRVRIS